MTKRISTAGEENSTFGSFGVSGTLLNEKLGHAGEVCLGACQTWQAEMSRFLLKRFERDTELARRLLECRDWTDAMGLQQQWAVAAVQDYLDQTRRVAEIAGKLWPLDIVPRKPAASDRPTDAAA